MISFLERYFVFPQENETILGLLLAGSVALITINSGAQIHPLIATRWCSSLKGKNLRYVMVANHAYLPNKVNFAARIAKHRVDPDVPLDLIASFKAAAATDPGGLILKWPQSVDCRESRECGHINCPT